MSRKVARSVALTAVLVGAAALADAGSHLAANPCAAKSANPCAAGNPSAPKNPCAAKNPCSAVPAAVKDRVAETAFTQYRDWKKVNTSPVLSATHGNRYVFTYPNKQAEPSGLRGQFPFPKGAVLVKESCEGQDGKPGPRGPVFIMEKRDVGYDRDQANWHDAMIESNGVVSLESRAFS